MPDPTVLCVDPDDDDRRITSRSVHDVAGTVLTADSAATARSIVEERRIDCLVTEYDLGVSTGLDLVERLRSAHPDAAAVLFTDADRTAIRTGVNDAIVDYLDKGMTNAHDRLAELVEASVDLGSQRSYPLPETEARRVTALEALDLADPALHSSLDRIVDLAATHFDLPLASVNVVGEHDQVFLVCRGADWSQSDRGDSVCAYTILEPGVTVVEDVRADPRFETVEELRAMGIRFYAGVPLQSPEGNPVATLCVYDREPGQFQPGDREYLATLGSVAEDLLATYHDADAGSRDLPDGGVGS